MVIEVCLESSAAVLPRSTSWDGGVLGFTRGFNWPFRFSIDMLAESERLCIFGGAA